MKNNDQNPQYHRFGMSFQRGQEDQHRRRDVDLLQERRQEEETEVVNVTIPPPLVFNICDSSHLFRRRSNDTASDLIAILDDVQRILDEDIPGLDDPLSSFSVPKGSNHHHHNRKKDDDDCPSPLQ